MLARKIGIIVISALLVAACSPGQPAEETVDLDLLITDARVEPAVSAQGSATTETEASREDDDDTDTDVVNIDARENANLIEMREEEIDPDENISVESAAAEPRETSMFINGQLATSAYMTINNEGDSPVTITGATTEVADTVLFVELNNRAGPTTVMNRLDSLTINAGETLTMDAENTFVVLVGLTQDIEEDQTIDLTLQFENGQTQVVQLSVQNNI